MLGVALHLLLVTCRCSFACLPTLSLQAKTPKQHVKRHRTYEKEVHETSAKLSHPLS